jgi:hypothetical protein
MGYRPALNVNQCVQCYIRLKAPQWILCGPCLLRSNAQVAGRESEIRAYVAAQAGRCSTFMGQCTERTTMAIVNPGEMPWGGYCEAHARTMRAWDFTGKDAIWPLQSEDPAQSMQVRSPQG